MITSWENEYKVRAEPSLLGFCRTAAAFMKLIMAAHTSWHSSEAASGDHWCKSRAETKLVWSLTRRSPMTGVAKTKQGLNGATRLNPYRLAKHRLMAVGMRQKSPRSRQRSEAIIMKNDDTA